MRGPNDLSTATVTPGANIYANLPRHGVLRLERKGGAMAGNPAMSFDEDDTLSLFFADGAALHLARD